MLSPGAQDMLQSALLEHAEAQNQYSHNRASSRMAILTDCHGHGREGKSPNIIRAVSSSMPAVHCLSCEHDNPAGAKFCAACGSTLNLKLCKQCEAINDGGAQRCHNCGTQFAAQSAAPAQSAGEQSGVGVAVP